MTVKFGLIGFGRFGKYHAQAIRQAKGTELVAISAKSADSCEKAREEFSLDTYTDYRELLARKDIEAVDIVVPNYLHKRIAIDCLNAGKHILLEKPMGISVEECDSILRAAAVNNRKVHIGFELRISALWGKIKSMIEDGKIGRPCFVNIELWRSPYRLGSSNWRYDSEKVGNWILEEPVHFFDLACWYMKSAGKPVSLYSRLNTKKRTEPKGIYDNMSFVINFDDDAYAVINQTLGAYHYRQYIKVVGTEGALSAKWEGAKDEDIKPTVDFEYFDGQNVKHLEIKDKSGEIYDIITEMEEMAKSVNGEKIRYLASGEDGKLAVVLSLAGEKSNELRAPIEL